LSRSYPDILHYGMNYLWIIVNYLYMRFCIAVFPEGYLIASVVDTMISCTGLDGRLAHEYLLSGLTAMP